jgi:Flp pilus assembly protein TadD
MREAVRVDPDDAEAHYDLGVALNEAGQRAEARAEWEKAMALDDEDVREDAREMLQQNP